MTSETTAIARLIHQAKAGDAKSLGDLLELHRSYLKLLVRRSLSPRLAVRIDESDLVQQTCLSAHRNFVQFRGASSAEFAAWLRQISEFTVSNQVRDQHAQRRSPNRELPLEAAQLAADGGASPAQRSLQGERAVLLAGALETLPRAQAEAVRLRYLEGLALAQIAERMQRTEPAVVGLLRRGLEALRSKLKSLGETNEA